MKSADGLLFVVGGVVLLVLLAFFFHQAAHRKDRLRDYRLANARAVQSRFGREHPQHPPAGSDPGPWHVRVETREEPMDTAGQLSALAGLREDIVLEDHRSERWRVTVESRASGETDLRVVALDPLGEAVRSAARKAA